MDKMAKVFGTITLGIFGLYGFVILTTLFGGINGWFIGLFFGSTILGIFGQLGIHGVSMWEIGIFLGFVCGHLKTKVTMSEKAK